MSAGFKPERQLAADVEAIVRDLVRTAALDSPLFREPRGGGMLSGVHDGGCVLFGKRREVEAILQKSKEQVS